jgi:hypothetical protein
MIQPFDGGKFDKRFVDVFAPAVESAGLTPYRVDRDPSVSIPIQEIERGIKSASACFVDISVDNANVWFELGYAIALVKDLCIVCSEERAKYPFDIQHRSIIRYQTESSSDFAKLSDSIAARIGAILENQKTRGELQSITDNRSKGLTDIDIACLGSMAAILAGMNDATTHFQIKSEMEKAGYNQLATNVALRNLLARALIGEASVSTEDGELFGFNLSEAGWEWLSSNLHHYRVWKSKKGVPIKSGDLDEEIPF